MEIPPWIWYVYVYYPFPCSVALLNFPGLTETSVAATCTSQHDVWHGSSGSLLPDYQLRIVGPNGEEITGYDEPGEVLFKSDNLFAGYFGDEESADNSFDSTGWMRTGDVGMMRLSPSGTEHLFIVDRIKDMIKVKVCSRPLPSPHQSKNFVLYSTLS